MIHFPHRPRQQVREFEPFEGYPHPDARRMEIALARIAAMILAPLIVWTIVVRFATHSVSPATAPPAGATAATINTPDSRAAAASGTELQVRR